MCARVLVVDDSAELRRLLGLIITMSDLGWTIAGEADNGESAIAAARESQPDLVLLDIAMPVMDGLEALPGIRAAAPGSRIVMLTGFADRTLADTARRAGADGYLEKDDLAATLMPALERIVHDARPTTTPGAEPPRQPAG